MKSSLVRDTSCLAGLNRQFLYGKCPKSVTIQYLRTGHIDGLSDKLLQSRTDDSMYNPCARKIMHSFRSSPVAIV